MSPLALTVMITICGIVWGGLLILIVHAMRSEGRKNRELT